MIDRGGMISWFLPVEESNPMRFQIKEIKKISDKRYKVIICVVGSGKMVPYDIDFINHEYAFFTLDNATKSMLWRASCDTDQKSFERAVLAFVEYCKTTNKIINM